MSDKSKALQELIHLVITLGSVVKDAEADGKIDVSDAALIFKLIPALGPALSDLSQIPGEISQIDASEAADLVAFVMSELPVLDGKAKEIINESLKTIGQLITLIKAIKA